MAEKLDLKKPYQTREGGRAAVSEGPDGCLYGWFYDMDEKRERSCESGKWTSDGHIMGAARMWDLVNVPELRHVSVWMNIFSRPDAPVVAYQSRGNADCASDVGRRVACVERLFTYTVGEGINT